MNKGHRISLAFAAAASVVVTGAALAHPHEGGDGKDVQKIIVLRDKDGKDATKHVREFSMLRSKDGTFTCPNGEATKVDETTAGERTKILICGDDKLSSAERAEKLEETLAKLRAEDHLSAEHRAKVEAALQGAIAKLRASN